MLRPLKPMYPPTSVATVPQTGPMAIIYRLTGGQNLRQVLPAMGAIIVSLIGLVFFVVSQQPERTTLYAALPEAEKARVVDALTNAGVDVALDPTTGGCDCTGVRISQLAHDAGRAGAACLNPGWL